MDIALRKNGEVKRIIILSTRRCTIAIKRDKKPVLITAKIVVVDIAADDVRSH
jgi:hypothetical protein